MPLVSIPVLKQFLNIAQSDVSKDHWLTALLAGVEATAENYCKRKFTKQTYTEFYSGNGTSYLILRQWPVHSITNLWEDTAANFSHGDGSPFASATLLDQGVDYVLEVDTEGTQSASGIVHRLNTVWPEDYAAYTPGRIISAYAPTLGSIKVTYVAGYDPVPKDLQMALCYLVSYMRRTMPQGGEIISEKVGDYAYTMADPLAASSSSSGSEGNTFEITAARSILANYREVAF